MCGDGMTMVKMDENGMKSWSTLLETNHFCSPKNSIRKLMGFKNLQRDPFGASKKSHPLKSSWKPCCYLLLVSHAKRPNGWCDPWLLFGSLPRSGHVRSRGHHPKKGTNSQNCQGMIEIEINYGKFALKILWNCILTSKKCGGEI